MKKYLLLTLILTSVTFCSFGYLGYLAWSENNTKTLINKCKNTNYKIKNLQENEYYKIDPNQDKLQIKINKIIEIANPKVYGITAYFGGSGIFEGCALEQIVEYNIIFEDKIVAKLDSSNEWDEKLYNFAQLSSFNKKDDVLDPLVEYNFEEKFLKSFRFQKKNSLILYTTSEDKNWAKNIDDDQIFIINNNQLNMINIPRNLFPRDSANQKNILDFDIIDNKLEIKFGLSDKMTIALNRPENQQSEGEYQKIWSNGNFTFCFELTNLSGKGLDLSKVQNFDQKNLVKNQDFQTKTYTLCQKDKAKFDKIISFQN